MCGTCVPSFTLLAECANLAPILTSPSLTSMGKGIAIIFKKTFGGVNELPGQGLLKLCLLPVVLPVHHYWCYVNRMFFINYGY